MKHYDAIVIGAGQAGPGVAAHFANEGKQVALVEGRTIGGTCVNYGCTPTKTLVASARAIHMARRGAEFGFSTGPVEVDMDAVISRKQKQVNSSQSGLEGWLRGIDMLDIYDDYGSFEGTENGVHRVRVGDEVIASQLVILNVGARPFVPPIDGLDSVPYMTNEGLINLRELPDHLLVLGGGYIGMELGQVWRRFGSKITMVEASSRILPHEDEDVAEEVLKILNAEGIAVHAGKKAVKAANENGSITLTLEAQDGSISTVSGSHLLVAVGRTPNSDRLNLEAVGVETYGRGYIKVDDHLQTNVPGIYALGDVNGRGAFTHTSYQDHEIFLDHINGGDRKVSDRNMAYAMYIDPPLGRVGMSEQEARKSGRKVLKAVKPMTSISRALEQSETFGLIKLLVDADTEQFLGAAVLGFHGDDVIQAISYYMATGATYHPMKEALPIHPTIAEFFPTILGELQPIEESA